MDMSGLPESLQARIAERSAQPPIEKVRSLLHGFVEDAESFDEIRGFLRRAARANTFYLDQYLMALESILAEPQPPGTLLRLVEGDANWGIDHDQTDVGAAAFLRDLAGLLHEVIDEANAPGR
jgi:hypothetical protein